MSHRLGAWRDSCGGHGCRLFRGPVRDHPTELRPLATSILDTEFRPEREGVRVTAVRIADLGVAAAVRRLERALLPRGERAPRLFVRRPERCAIAARLPAARGWGRRGPAVG